MNSAIEHTKLSNDTLITLSQIESGCLFIQHSDKTLMIIKSTEDEINSLTGLEQISLKTELIEKPEFPTIAAYIRIHTKDKGTYDFEYYFNIEASQEMELLGNLCAQNNIEIILFDTAIVHSTILELKEEDKSVIKTLLVEAGRLFDKA